MTVRGTVTKEVSFRPETNAAAAGELIWIGIRSVHPVAGDEKRQTEIVTDWDLSNPSETLNDRKAGGLPVGSRIRHDDAIIRVLERKGFEVWSVPADAPVFEAILRMSQARVGALLVFDRGKLAGMVSERDYARKVILRGRSSSETLVREIMTAPVIFVGPAATIDECMQLITERRIRHLPVLEGETVMGVISMGDLVQWVISADETMVEQLNNYITGQYPA